MSDQDQIGRLVSATANRVRQIQHQFADASEAERREHVSQSVRRAAESLPPSERKRFLNELEQVFPAWQSSAGGGEVRIPTQSTQDTQQTLKWDFLLDKLIAIAPSLTELQRQAIIRQMRQAGLTGGGNAEWSQESETMLREKLGLKPTQELDGGRILETAAMMADVVDRLEQLVWRSWRMIVPQSSKRQPPRLLTTIARYACNEGQTSRGDVHDPMEKLRMVMASLITAIGEVSHQLATRLADMGPQKIEELVKVEGGGGWLKSTEVRCWDKFKQLAQDLGLHDATVEGWIRRELADSAERLINGPHR